MKEENLRPIIATHTDHLPVPKTVHMLVVVVTDRSEFPTNNVRERFSFDPTLCLSFKLVNLDAPADPVASDASHHVKNLPLGIAD